MPLATSRQKFRKCCIGGVYTRTYSQDSVPLVRMIFDEDWCRFRI